METEGRSLAWVVLTTGGRPDELTCALDSIEPSRAVVVANGAPGPVQVGSGDRVQLVRLLRNVGVPAGRDAGLKTCDASIVGFLDDDAVASPGVSEAVSAAFAADRSLGAVSLRLVDEDGATARRHVPRFGRGDADVSGPVTLFLGGACAIRREAYDHAGGYWGELFYGHEELELSWRLIDRGWGIRYLADTAVFHPRSEVGRHTSGWRQTGRNRVMIARRTLPWPVAGVHVLAWLALGGIRAPGWENKRAYLGGWWRGWSQPVDRDPIRWATVWRLTRLGRPPVL